jgi:rubredoxin
MFVDWRLVSCYSCDWGFDLESGPKAENQKGGGKSIARTRLGRRVGNFQRS